jgi:Carboxypeptidase regulatory-like domain
VPSDGDAELELTLEGIISGRLESESGRGLENFKVRIERWEINNGIKQLQTYGDVTTDDRGQFRIAELPPGNYLLSFTAIFGPGMRVIDTLSPRNTVQQGYGALFYPGVSDLASATWVRLRPGAEVQITQNT